MRLRLTLRLSLPVLLIATPLLAAPARAEADTRVFGSATAAVMGGIVAGPIGLVAGAAIGYFLGPALSKVSVGPSRRVARRRARVPLAAAPPQGYPQQAYAPPGYPGQPLVPGQAPYPGQPMYLAQTSPVPAGAQSPGMPMMQPGAVSPGIAARPAYYAAVPVPMPVGPSGNYAARAYVPRNDGATPDAQR